jgi:ABC-type sugar transport system substrate-binding protein
MSAVSDRAQGRSVTADILQRHPDLTMIFAANDEMALGAVEAVAAVGKAGQIQIIGFGGTKDAVAAIQAGTMAGTLRRIHTRWAKCLSRKQSRLLRVKDRKAHRHRHDLGDQGQRRQV